MTDVVLKVGQVWADNDPRGAAYYGRERHIMVVEVLPNGARCKVVQHGNTEMIGRETLILAKRFRPTKGGYRLISEAVHDEG